MATIRGRRDKSHDTRSSEWIGDMDVWKRLNAETNEEQLARLKANLMTAIQEDLSPRQQQMLSMRYFQGLSGVEIARSLGVSSSTVSRTLKRAEKRLHKVLKYAL